MVIVLLALAVVLLAIGGFHPSLPTWIPGLCSTLAAFLAVAAAAVWLTSTTT